MSLATFYAWKSRFGGMDVSDVAKMRSLEDENRRLRKLLADSAPEIDALKLVVSGNFCRLLRAAQAVIEKIGLSERKATIVATCNRRTYRRKPTVRSDDPRS
jgi:putative transposase